MALHFWPLCDYERIDAQSRFRALKLWPLRHSAMVEREFAPIWTLYQHTTAGANSSDELLWGLVRRQNRGDEASRVQIQAGRGRRGGAHPASTPNPSELRG